MKTSSIVLPKLSMLAIFQTGCLEETATNKYEENILTENLIIPSTFQELSGLFLELNLIVLFDDEEEASLSYIYESTEVINGVEADKFISC